MTSAKMTAPKATAGNLANKGFPWLAWLALALSAVMAVILSRNKVLNQDEIFSLQTDRVATLGEVLKIQRYYPISLEAPTYHVLSHAAMSLFGPTAFALRLPSLLGFLLLQVCLYFFVRNIAGEGSGLMAMAIPALSVTFFYAAEGRPYGLLLGGCALCVLCWQIAARRGDAGEDRMVPLACLVIALWLTLTVHFYGVLVLPPLCGAEIVRSYMRGRVDKPMIVALVLGMASIATTLPYIKASSEFKKHYYAAFISSHMMVQPYRQMLIEYASYAPVVQTALAIALLLLAATAVAGCVRAYRSGRARMSAGEITLLVLVAAIPLVAFVLGKFVSHALEPRHSYVAMIAVASVLGIGAGGLLRNARIFYGVIAGILACIVLVNGVRAHEVGVKGRAMRDALRLTPEQSATIDQLPDRNLYFQDLGQWEFATEYVQDPSLQSRLVLVYSFDEEMKWRQHDTLYLTAIHTMKFSNKPITSYDALRRSAEPHVFVTFHTGANWTDQAFAEEATTTSLGQAFGGELLEVRFRQQR